MQLDFFLKTEEDYKVYEANELRKELGNLRKGSFSRFGDLYKLYSDLLIDFQKQKSEIEDLKHILDEYVAVKD